MGHAGEEEIVRSKSFFDPYSFRDNDGNVIQVECPDQYEVAKGGKGCYKVCDLYDNSMTQHDECQIVCKDGSLRDQYDRCCVDQDLSKCSHSSLWTD